MKMTLQKWFNYGWLKEHKTSREEIANLLMIVNRDLEDAAVDISHDWQFGIAYNAALKLCTVLLYAEGFRPERNLQHYRIIEALPMILGKKRRAGASYLNTCRTKRNIIEYDYVGGVSEKDVKELIEVVRELKKDVMKWVKEKHPELA